MDTPASSAYLLSMKLRPLALLGLVGGCGETTAACCGPEGCAAISDDIVGSDVLRFRGRVPRNLLFLSVDTLRRDHVGAYADTELTPFLDRLAAEGVVATAHQQCANWTLGSMTCTLAGSTNVDRGHIPRTTGIATELPRDTELLATWLADADFRTAVVSANDHWFSSDYGATTGYQRERTPGGNGNSVGEEALDLLGGRTGRERWFLHEHYMEPHSPYNPPDEFSLADDDLEPWPENLRNRDIHYDNKDAYRGLDPDEQALLGAHLRRLYQGDVRTLDHRLETHFEALDQQCWLDDTLVVVFNDHGEAFWEHGLQAHGANLFGEETDGVLLFWAKNLRPGTWAGPTSAIDLVPTLLDLFDVPMPHVVTGLPLGTATDDRPLFADAFARRKAVQAVTHQGLRMQFTWRAGDARVFDRNTDPDETRQLYDPDDPDHRALWRLLEPEVERMAQALGWDPPDPPPGME